MLPNNNICVLPWMSIEVTPMGNSRPCCLAIDEIPDAQGKSYDLTEVPIQEVYHSKYMQDLRQQFRAGEKPETCSRCWTEESAGRTSKRMNMLAKFNNDIPLVEWNTDTPEQLWFLDLKLGNICNLKCRICGSWSSSKWAQEELDYYPTATREERKKHSAYVWLRQGQWPRESTDFWNNIDQVLPGVRYYEFTGGEPFLIQEHFDLLQRTVDQGYAHLVDVHYNTNGTQYPEAAVEMWKKFKHVNIAFSIDDLGPRFEYQRYGAEWAEVEQNLDRYLELSKAHTNITLQMCITANIQNVLYLPEVMDYVWAKGFRDVYINMLHDPVQLNIKQMTPAAITLVCNRLAQVPVSNRFYRDFQQLITVIQTGTGSNGHEFCETIRRGDVYRKQNFADHHPDIAKAMGYE